MAAFGRFIIGLVMGFGNLFLGYWALGHVLNHWQFSPEFTEFFTFKGYWGIMFILGVLRAGTTGSLVGIHIKSQKADGENVDKLATMKNHFYTAIVLLLTVATSWIWTSLFY